MENSRLYLVAICHVVVVGILTVTVVPAEEIFIYRSKTRVAEPNDFKIHIRNKQCDRGANDSINYFASKTPYPTKFVDSITPQGCRAQQIWILGRHGTRYPSERNIRQMQDDLPVLRNLINRTRHQASLCNDQMDAIVNWTPYRKLNPSQANWLVDQGYREWRQISSRFQRNFPNLFPPTFSNDSYYFRATTEQRTRESARAFAGAIFGQSLPNFYMAPPINGDPILRFYRNCTSYIRNVVENSQANTEHRNFLRSSIFKNAQQTVSDRLGLQRCVTVDEFLSMYNACTFETALRPANTSAWCAVFEREQLEVLEYQEDLEDYYMDGYGFPINSRQACRPIRDVVQTFAARIHGDSRYYNDGQSRSNRLTTAYFAHSGTILKLYARLGLFRDDQSLRSDNFLQFNHGSRQWRTGQFGGFASSIAFVLFDCPDHYNVSFYKIGTLVQERPMALPACNGNWLCPFSEFVKNVASIVNTCDLADICRAD